MYIHIDYYMSHFNWMIKVYENIGVPFWINLVVNVTQIIFVISLIRIWPALITRLY